jgi:hypothetical protein
MMATISSRLGFNMSNHTDRVKLGHGKSSIARLVSAVAYTGLFALCALCACACAQVSRAAVTVSAKNEQVLLVPNINAGTSGWCVVIADEAACPTGASGNPIIAEGWSSSGPPPVAEGYLLTTGSVASVIVGDAPPIRTRRDSSLPGGLRAVVVTVRGGGSRLPISAVNAKGERIRAEVKHGLPLSSVEIATRSVSGSGEGACGIEAAPLGGLTVGGGSVVRMVKAYPTLGGDGFLACASRSYTLDGWPLLAGVLLRASDPGERAAPLPAMQPVPGYAGIFQAPGFEGEMVARRIPGGWLAVAKGSGLRQRLALLNDLHAAVRV